MKREQFSSPGEMAIIPKIYSYVIAGAAGLNLEQHRTGGIVLTLAAIGLKYASVRMENLNS